jgi:serine/threonine protein kinase
VKYLHDQRIIHRDLKSANLLYNNKGEVKIADFGLGRLMSSSVSQQYSNYVVTLNYRAPELLLETKDYDTQIDMWSLGCIFAELLINDVLFKGDKEPRMIEQIYKICGTPDTTIWANCDKLRLWNQFKPLDF